VGLGRRSKVLVIHNPQHNVRVLGLSLLATGIIPLVPVPVVEGVVDHGMAIAQGDEWFIGVATEAGEGGSTRIDPHGIGDIGVGDDEGGARVGVELYSADRAGTPIGSQVQEAGILRVASHIRTRETSAKLITWN